MRKVTKATSVERTAVVQGQVVKFQHVTLNRPSNTKYVLQTAFDFAGVQQDQILRLAGETLLIRWRTAFKEADTIDDNADGQVVKVTKMLQGRKPRMSASQKVEKLAGTLSREQLIALQQQIADRLADEDDENSEEDFDTEDESEEEEQDE